MPQVQPIPAEVLREETSKPWGALHLAVHQASPLDVRQLLLDDTVDTEETIERNFTPLLLAAQEGRVECISEVKSKTSAAGILVGPEMRGGIF